jgi:drug/metabolite transporter (DMT)-like permease
MGYLKIITAILIWSSLGIIIRKIKLSNIDIIFFTSAIAGLLQFVLLSSARLIKRDIKIDSDLKSISLLLLIPVFFVANTLLFYFAFKHTTIANSVLTHYTAPVFVAFLAPILIKEKIHRSSWIAIIFSSIGLLFILNAADVNGNLSGSNREILGITAGALSGLAYAFLIMIVRNITHKYSSLFITFVQNGMIVLILLPFMLTLSLPLEFMTYLIILGVIHSTIAPLLYVQGFRTVKANEAAILGYLEPVGAIILALFFLHEVPGFKAMLGGALILFSGFMIIRSRGG